MKIGKFHGPKARKAIKHFKDLVYGLYSIGLSFMDKFIFLNLSLHYRYLYLFLQKSKITLP